MYQPVFTRLGLTGSGAFEVSQPVSMQGANSVQVDYVVLSISGTSTPTVSFQVQESNDLENWTNKGSAFTATTIGFSLATAITGVGTGYVRLKASITAGTSPVFVVGAGINTASL